MMDRLSQKNRPFLTIKCADANPSRFGLPEYESIQYAKSRGGINNPLMLFIAKYVAVKVDGLTLSKKKPLYEPSLHCKSVLLATSTREMASAAAGVIPAPNEELEVTAVPANSTPRAPFPVTGS